MAIAPQKIKLVNCEERPLKEKEVKIKSDLASPKHATESHRYLNDQERNNRSFHPEDRILLRTEQSKSRYPIALGNIMAGTIVDKGKPITKFDIDDKVYAHLPISEPHTIHENGSYNKVNTLGSGVRERNLHKIPPGVTAKRK